MQPSIPVESDGVGATEKCLNSALLYREGPEGAPVERIRVPCRGRRCGYCGPKYWRPTTLAKMHSGIVDGRTDYLAVLLTAPGADQLPDYWAIQEWNAGASKRWHHFMTLLRREWPTRDVQFWRVAELQERGAIHFHFVVRGLRRRQLSKRRLRRLAVQAGFGPIVGVARPQDYPGGVRSAGYYFAKYLLKAYPGNLPVKRMVTMSQGWKLSWVKHERPASPRPWIYRRAGQHQWGDVVWTATPPRPSPPDSSPAPSWWRSSWQAARGRWAATAPAWE